MEKYLLLYLVCSEDIIPTTLPQLMFACMCFACDFVFVYNFFRAEEHGVQNKRSAPKAIIESEATSDTIEIKGKSFLC